MCPNRYTTDPLYIIQELMLGKAVDKQLYVEHWRPTPQQVRYRCIPFRVADGCAPPADSLVGVSASDG